MTARSFPRPRAFASLLLCCFLLPHTARAQEDEVVRVSAELVQTDVMVFDDEGRFVDGLRPEQFELRVDGQPVPISFFERVAAGTVDEDAQLAAARGGRLRPAGVNAGAALPLDRGRVVAFFVDDLHLSPESLKRTRDTLRRFIDEELGQNDQAVVASASGQLGFLQQLTGDKTVLRRAVSQLNYRAVAVRDFERPPMSEAHARAVERRDTQVVGYFVDRLMQEVPGLRRDIAENQVAMRASQIIQQADAVTVNTLATLESLVRSSAQVPGRKLVFFISDGFHLHARDSRVRDRVRRISDAAARSGAVIYTLDARGLTSGLADASSDGAFDPSGRLSRADMGERSALQEPLFTLAADTGGRALVNTNALGPPLARALKETSVYYLLAWRPEEGEGQKRNAKFRRIEAAVKGRPDLKVVVRRGFFDAPVPPARPPAAEAKGTKASDKKTAVAVAEEELLDALRATFPRTALPLALSLGYTSPRQKASVLTISVEVDRDALDYTPPAGAQQKAGEADVLGAVLDAQGKVVGSFKHELIVRAPESNGAGGRATPLSYSHELPLAPGLYQVRIAARDRKSGRAGSVAEWVEVPDLTRGRLALSSIFVGERKGPEVTAEAGGAESFKPVALSAGRRFSRDSRMRFIFHIYNAATPAAPAARPDVALQVQVFRDDQPVITTPLRKVNTEEVPDAARIPYGAELDLDKLPAGRYALQVTAIDRVAKTSASQRVNFTIE